MFDQFTLLREEIAVLIHEKWSVSVKFMLSNLEPENIEKWSIIAETAFNELSEEDRKLSYEWTDKIMLIYADLVLNRLSAQFDKWESESTENKFR